MARDVAEAAAELRNARLRAGLTLRAVGTAAGVSYVTILRNESATLPGPKPMMLARHAAAVGLRARIRLYPGDGAIRDAGQVALIRSIRERIGNAGRWAFEVPIPLPGDQRALDAVLAVASGRIGLEFYVRLADCQAQLRAAHLKQRDAGLDRLVIVVKATHANRRALREAEPAIADTFPGTTRPLLATLAAGKLPTTNGVILF
jgi:transcriptional regulator with XRE-family HTH domain